MAPITRGRDNKKVSRVPLFLAQSLKAVSERARKLYVTKHAIIAKDIYLYNWEIFMFFDKGKTRSYDIWLLENAAPRAEIKERAKFT